MSERRTGKSRLWIWFFAVLAVLGTAAVGINWAWNAGEPLTLERLQAARRLWQRQRPPDYDLKITVMRYNARQVDVMDVRVRGGRIVEFLSNRKEPEPLLDKDGNPNVAEEKARREAYDVNGLFDAIEEFMERDGREGKKSFLRARFDGADGHVTSFTRQLNGVREVYFKVEMKRVSTGA